jgi:ATP diphosphatase
MSEAPTPITHLLGIMAALRDPDTGCPWDREQNFSTIAPYAIEEAYEVVEAIRQDDMNALREELGDLLFQVVFHSQMSSEDGGFTFDDVVRSISEKMVRRHPHVFASAETVDDAEVQTRNWESIKAAERHDKSGQEAATSVLDDVPLSFPALLRAHKLQRRAARVGFDWPDTAPIYDKVDEEIGELQEATSNKDKDEQSAEVGDLLFTCVNLARHLGIDPENALRIANAKFESRFRQIEAWLAQQDRTPAQSTLAEMDALWNRAKTEQQRLDSATDRTPQSKEDDL